MSKINSTLQKRFGKPLDASEGGQLGAGTEAAGRSQKASSIEKGKFTGGCSMYGTEGVSGPGGGHGGRTSSLTH